MISKKKVSSGEKSAPAAPGCNSGGAVLVPGAVRSLASRLRAWFGAAPNPALEALAVDMNSTN